MQDVPFEIERKFLIRYPDTARLDAVAERSEISQTYLLCDETRSERVRRRSWADKTEYTHTVKTRITDVRRIEVERQIEREEYEKLLERADPARITLSKLRYCLPYQGQTLEIDVFPFWDDRAYLEIEMGDEAQSLSIPPEFEVIREVTEDRRYTNASLAREIPYDEI